MRLAASDSEWIVKGDRRPDEAEKKAGKYLLLYVMTGTPFVSKYSKVLGMSRMDLTPAETTVTGVRAS